MILSLPIQTQGMAYSLFMATFLSVWYISKILHICFSHPLLEGCLGTFVIFVAIIKGVFNFQRVIVVYEAC